MLGIRVSVPVACFRKGMAREYLETEILPPPSTCYGFLLSLVGETHRRSHIGARVTAGLLNQPDLSVVLRTVWRVKSKPLGSSGNTRPDYQQLLSNIQLTMWIDSSEESGASLENRIRDVVVHRRFSDIRRFGGLSLGESTHLVDEVSPFSPDEGLTSRTFLLDDKGKMTLPVWVDHVGSSGTSFVVGNITALSVVPDPRQLPRIAPVPPSL